MNLRRQKQHKESPQTITLSGPASPRTGVVVTHPIQYFSPLWRELSHHLNTRVLYLRKCEADYAGLHDTGFGRQVSWDVDLLGGYKWSSAGLKQIPFKVTSTDLLKILHSTRKWIRAENIDVVLIPGWTMPYLAVRVACQLEHRAVIMRPEARAGLVSWRSIFRDLLLKRIVRGVSSFAVIGTDAKRELTRLGVEPHRLFNSLYTIDDQLWKKMLDEKVADRSAIRERLGYKDFHVVFFYSGKLQGYKRVSLLIQALALVCRSRPEARLLVAGTGPDEAALRAEARSLGVEESVNFVGFMNQTELPAMYVAADAYVLASFETWGLVVNEAAIAGLPLIVASTAGAAVDLVSPGLNGWRVSPLVEQIAAAMDEAMDPELRRRYANNSSLIAEQFNIRSAAAGIAKAAEHAACLAISGSATDAFEASSTLDSKS